MQPIAIIQHVADDGPSYFATFLTRVGRPFQVFRMDLGDALPERITDFAGLCILGGPMSADDALPYFPHLFAQVREAIAADIPVIGHCLGGQIMAKALGGSIQASEQVEIGWSDLRVEAQADRWFGGGAAPRLFQWHGESFSIPAGAQRIVTGDFCANQAFVVGNKHLAMQFHCEVDEAKVQRWLVLGHDELISCVSPAVQQVTTILPDLPAQIAQSQRTADLIYGEWIKGLAGQGD